MPSTLSVSSDAVHDHGDYVCTVATSDGIRMYHSKGDVDNSSSNSGRIIPKSSRYITEPLPRTVERQNSSDFMKAALEIANDHHRSASRPGPITQRNRSFGVSAPRLQELKEKYIPNVFDKTPEDEEIIREALAVSFIFKKLADEPREQLIRAFEPVDSYKKGDAICEQNDVGDYFYILGKGSILYEVNGEEEGRDDRVGTAFGELSLLYESPREVTVRADSDETLLYRVDHVTFRYILQSRSKFKALGMQAVTKVKAANRFLGFIGKSARTLLVEEDSDSDSDIEEDEPQQDSKDGDAQVDKQEAKSDDEVDEYGDAALDSYFRKMQAMGKIASDRRQSIRSSITSTAVSADSFRRNSMLGEGQFGEVWLVQPNIEEIDTEQFALKIQSKEDMGRAKSEYSVEEAIKRECDVLSELCHPFIVDLVHSFEDEENIYMVMGAIKGIELFDYIHREVDDGEWVSGIPEDHARFYAIVIADTLNYMHCQMICHRDMKPENVMINEKGYPILVDFGFAKKIPDDRTYTLCGSPKYTAPEIIINEGHGCAVDHWSLGVIIYEMISGENPFWYDGISDLQLMDDICNAKPYPVEKDADCSKEVQDLLHLMLEKGPENRLVGKEVIEHPWFEGIDLELARNMELTAPWIPPHEDKE